MEIWYTMTGVIEKKVVQDSILWINEQLYSKPVHSLRFLLASGGGEIVAGVNMHMYLKALPIEVEMIGFGEVDAAAIPIFLGGAKRVAVDGCQFFFHDGKYTITDPTASIHGHEEAITVFKRELQQMIDIIAERTGNDPDAVAKILRRSRIMQTDEAKDFGLCHEIISTLPLQQQEKVGFQSSE